MDKIGPICRAVEDCAIVLSAIYGQDGRDLTVKPAAMNWDASFDWKKLRVGYFKSAFDLEPLAADATPQQKSAYDRRAYEMKFNTNAIPVLQKLGVNLIPVEMPKFPFSAVALVLDVEAAAAFDDLTMSGRDALLTEQGVEDWPNAFRIARYYPAVEYIQANRARTLAIQQVSALFDHVDIIVTPSTDAQLVATNLTGHPALIVPNGLRGQDAPRPPKLDDGDHDDIGGPGTPVSLTFLAGHYQDAKLAAFGWAYQQATGFHKLHPKLD